MNMVLDPQDIRKKKNQDSVFHQSDSLNFKEAE
jgi:catabolite regulation protein CreA